MRWAGRPVSAAEGAEEVWKLLEGSIEASRGRVLGGCRERGDVVDWTRERRRAVHLQHDEAIVKY